MKLIVITPPLFFEGEAKIITSLFDAGLKLLHLRKPEASSEEIERLLSHLPQKYLPYIVVHQHFHLAAAYGLKGVHLNSRNLQLPTGHTGHVSCSCHSLSEVVRQKPHCNYVFLSPVYDSISKEGYKSNFPLRCLQQAQTDGIIDQRVIALGGICEENLKQIQNLGFGGAALLGDIWNRDENPARHFLKLKQLVETESLS